MDTDEVQELCQVVQDGVSKIFPVPVLQELSWILGFSGEMDFCKFCALHIAGRREVFANEKRDLIQMIFPGNEVSDIVLGKMFSCPPYLIWYGLVSFLNAIFEVTTFNEIEVRIRDLLRWQFLSLAVPCVTHRYSEAVTPRLSSILYSRLIIAPNLRVVDFSCDPRLTLYGDVPLTLLPRARSTFSFLYRSDGCSLRRLLMLWEADALRHAGGTTGKDLLVRAQRFVSAYEADIPLKSLLRLVVQGMLVRSPETDRNNEPMYCAASC